MARKRQKQSRMTERISRTERKLLAAFRSMTMAASHLERSKECLQAASSSEDFMIHAVKYQSLYGVALSRFVLLLLMAISLHTTYQWETSGTTKTKLKRRLQAYQDRLAASISMSTTPASAPAVHTGEQSELQPDWATSKNLRWLSSGKPPSRNHRNISPTKAMTAR